MARSVIFVGKADCLELHIDSHAVFDDVIKEITGKLEESGSFFRGSSAIYVLGKLNEGQQNTLQKLLKDGYGFKQVEFAKDKAAAKTEEKRSPAVPIPIREEDIPEAPKKTIKLRTAKRKEAPLAIRDEGMAVPARVEAPAANITVKERSGALFNWGVPKQSPAKWQNDLQNVRENHVIMVYETIHSGQSVAYDGDIVVLGDVNQGAELIASGSIVIMGVLRGMAHAGSAGDETASVSANRLVPQQLRIGARLAIAPDDMQTGEGLEPERAFVDEGEIVVRYLSQTRTRKRR